MTVRAQDEVPAAPARRARVVRRRRAGRPAAPRAEGLRERIVEAASNEFGRAGLGGARVERIAAKAGVNVRMLYYYFGSKDGLFLAALEHVYTEIRKAERGLELERAEPVEAMRRLVRFSWEYYFSHPQFIALLNSENLHEGRHLQGAKRLPELHSPLLKRIAQLLERGERSGVFRGGVDPMQLYISIAALGYFYLSNRHTLSAIFKRDLMAPKLREARLGHMTEVILGYLRPLA